MGENHSVENQAASQALPPGYELDEYVIEKEIGAGGFGITYKAYDKQLNRHVAVKEYFPFNLAARDQGLLVSPKTRVAQDVDEYDWGLSRFIDEARTLALFEHPSIIRVIRYLECNNTAYIIMDFADGRDVSDVLKNDGLLSVDQLKDILLPIAEGLAAVHSADMLHRDIKPGNIRLRENGTAVLIDFGAARQAIGVRSQSISTILTPGYAPIEQYSTRGNQGPWTDIYALAAVGYVCLTGENLSHYEATERIRNDQLPKLVDRIKGGDRVFLESLDWALSPEENDRPQTVQKWLDAIRSGAIPGIPEDSPSNGGTVKLAANQHAEQQYRKKSAVDDKTENKKSFNWLTIAVVFGVVVSAAMFYLASGIDKQGVNSRTVMNAPADNRPTKDSSNESAVHRPVAQNPKPAPAIVETPPVTQQPGNHAQDNRDFETASKINTAEAYTLYLRLHPNGRHREKITRARR
jgi:serine/threonine protein kinase